MGIVTARYIIPHALMSSPSLHRTSPFSWANPMFLFLPPPLRMMTSLYAYCTTGLSLMLVLASPRMQTVHLRLR